MKKFLWLAAGIALGMVAAKQIETNPKAKKAYNDVTSALKDVAAAFADGYEQEKAPAKPATKKTAK